MMPSLDKVFDVAVIGGGLTGAAIARDCATRRLSVALIEKEDLCAGGTGASAGLLHGGPRYFEPGAEASRTEAAEIETLQRIAPNLISRVPMIYPVRRDEPKSYLDRIETLAGATRKPHFRLDAHE